MTRSHTNWDKLKCLYSFYLSVCLSIYLSVYLYTYNCVYHCTSHDNSHDCWLNPSHRVLWSAMMYRHLHKILTTKFIYPKIYKYIICHDIYIYMYIYIDYISFFIFIIKYPMIIPMFVGWIPLNAILTRAPIWFHPRATVSGQVLEAGGVRALDIGAGTGLFGAQWVFELQRGSIIKKYKDIIHKLCLVDDCYIWLYHFMGIWFHIIYIYIYMYTHIQIYIYI